MAGIGLFEHIDVTCSARNVDAVSLGIEEDIVGISVHGNRKDNPPGKGVDPDEQSRVPGANEQKVGRFIEGHGEIAPGIRQFPGIQHLSSGHIGYNDRPYGRHVDKESAVPWVQREGFRMTRQGDLAHPLKFGVKYTYCTASVCHKKLPGCGIVTKVIRIFTQIDPGDGFQRIGVEHQAQAISAIGNHQFPGVRHKDHALRLIEPREAPGPFPLLQIHDLKAVVPERGDEKHLCGCIYRHVIDPARHTRQSNMVHQPQGQLFGAGPAGEE